MAAILRKSKRFSSIQIQRQELLQIIPHVQSHSRAALSDGLSRAQQSPEQGQVLLPARSLWLDAKRGVKLGTDKAASCPIETDLETHRGLRREQDWTGGFSQCLLLIFVSTASSVVVTSTNPHWLPSAFSWDSCAVPLYFSRASHVPALLLNRWWSKEAKRVRVRNPPEFFPPCLSALVDSLVSLWNSNFICSVVALKRAAGQGCKVVTGSWALAPIGVPLAFLVTSKIPGALSTTARSQEPKQPLSWGIVLGRSGYSPCAELPMQCSSKDVHLPPLIAWLFREAGPSV